MKRIVPLFCLAAAVTMSAQTAPKTSPTPAKTPAAPAAKAPAARTTSPLGYKLPPGEKRVPGIPKTAFVLRYQEIKIGTGAEAEPGKLWHVLYKGWRAGDGVVFDASEEHRKPVMGKDGKPEMGPDGKPKMGDPEPLAFPEGTGRLIPGFDFGVSGMRIGGKRRIFIPYQMAYGTRTIPDRPDHPGIPAKSNLIFDVELVDVTDMPAQPQRPMFPPGGGSVRPQPVMPRPGTPGAPAPGTVPPGGGVPPPAGAKPATPPSPGTQPAPAQPGQPSPPPQPQNPPQPK
ncbi:MAG TPA: FKBP-type peptidyl-prolyl cis-trans isomerase [Terracidiphilus sp.]|jgi:peptidylprolyl isomerase|nr:FKBP-type peptidyl-prolyl cis-trans isomerase [Terracidiphilus sp.]